MNKIRQDTVLPKNIEMNGCPWMSLEKDVHGHIFLEKIGIAQVWELRPSERKVPGMTIEEMKNVDVRTVDRECLVDADSVVIDETLPREEQMQEFVRQIRNPYCFRVGDMVVKNVYSEDGVSLRERFEQFAAAL